MDEATKQYIDDELKKNAILYASYGIDTEQLAVAIVVVAEAARAISERLNEAFGNIISWFDEYNLSLDSSEFHKTEKLGYKLSFVRPIIKHQVLDRKPKQLIKKIIY